MVKINSFCHTIASAARAVMLVATLAVAALWLWGCSPSTLKISPVDTQIVAETELDYFGVCRFARVNDNSFIVARYVPFDAIHIDLYDANLHSLWSTHLTPNEHDQFRIVRILPVRGRLVVITEQVSRTDSSMRIDALAYNLKNGDLLDQTTLIEDQPTPTGVHRTSAYVAVSKDTSSIVVHRLEWTQGKANDTIPSATLQSCYVDSSMHATGIFRTRISMPPGVVSSADVDNWGCNKLTFAEDGRFYVLSVIDGSRCRLHRVEPRSAVRDSIDFTFADIDLRGEKIIPYDGDLSILPDSSISIAMIANSIDRLDERRPPYVLAARIAPNLAAATRLSTIRLDSTDGSLVTSAIVFHHDASPVVLFGRVGMSSSIFGSHPDWVDGALMILDDKHKATLVDHVENYAIYGGTYVRTGRDAGMFVYGTSDVGLFTSNGIAMRVYDFEHDRKVSQRAIADIKGSFIPESVMMLEGGEMIYAVSNAVRVMLVRVRL